MLLKNIFNAGLLGTSTAFTSLCRTFKKLPGVGSADVCTGLIKKTLKEHDVSFEEGYTSIISKVAVCKNCKSLAKSNPRLYINKTTGKKYFFLILKFIFITV